VEALLTALRRRGLAGDGPPDLDIPAPSAREAAALAAAREELDALLVDLAAGVPYDLLGVRLETASLLLAAITGETSPEEVLNAVFDRFCIGK
jgi:tRNA modification GTPase